jgi:hypothetical protein
VTVFIQLLLFTSYTGLIMRPLHSAGLLQIGGIFGYLDSKMVPSPNCFLASCLSCQDTYSFILCNVIYPAFAETNMQTFRQKTLFPPRNGVLRNYRILTYRRCHVGETPKRPIHRTKHVDWCLCEAHNYLHIRLLTRVI